MLKNESDNFNAIVLYKEGMFWRAYERSAMLFVLHIKAFQLTKKYIKNAQSEVVYLGFPDTGLKTVLEIMSNKIIEKSEKQIICRSFTIIEEDFTQWKSKISITPEKQAKTQSNAVRVNAKAVLEQLNKFPVAAKTSEECQQFIVELQTQLNGTV